MNPILERLLKLMAERGLTAKKVTEDCKMSGSSFTDWKKGKASPGVEAISKLSAYFDVSTDYLIKGVEYKDRFNAGPTITHVPDDSELLARYHRIPQEHRSKVIFYLDGMLAMMPLQEHQGQEKDDN